MELPTKEDVVNRAYGSRNMNFSKTSLRPAAHIQDFPLFQYELASRFALTRNEHFRLIELLKNLS